MKQKNKNKNPTSAKKNPRKFFCKEEIKQRYDKKMYPKLFSVTTIFSNVDKRDMINHHRQHKGALHHQQHKGIFHLQC